MKNINAPTALLIGIGLFTSCDPKDTPNTPPAKNSIIFGKWYPIDAVVEGTVFPYYDHEDCGKDYLEFKSTGRVNEVDVFNCEEIPDGSGTYTLDNDILLFNYDDIETIEAKIIELNQVSLIFETELDVDDNGSLETAMIRYER